MKKILLIRRNQRDNPGWEQLLRQVPGALCDVCRPSEIDIRSITTEGEVSVSFRGVDVSRFDHIFYLGLPVMEAMNDDAQFAWSERDASLIAAFRAVKAPVFNPALALAFNKVLQNQIPFCKQWERLGWKVPAIEYAVDASGYSKKLDPDPARNTCYLLYCSTNDYFLWPGYRIVFLHHDKFLHLLAATQQEMWRTGYDLLIFRIFELAGDFYLFGHVNELPILKDNTRATKLIIDLLS